MPDHRIFVLRVPAAAKIAEAAQKIDFTRGIDPTVLAKAVAGDSAALLQVINSAARQAFTIGTQASTQLVDKHVSAVREHMQSELPSHLRSLQATDGLLTDNPKFAHPAVQPLIQAISHQLQSQFPTATSTELQNYAVKYLQETFSIIGDTKSSNGEASRKSPGRGGEQQKKQAAGQFDWNTWAEAQSADQQ